VHKGSYWQLAIGCWQNARQRLMRHEDSVLAYDFLSFCQQPITNNVCLTQASPAPNNPSIE
jgi:hypothetical protein